MDYRSCPVCEETIANAQRDIAKAKKDAEEYIADQSAQAQKNKHIAARRVTRIEQAKVLVPATASLAIVSMCVAAIVRAPASPPKPCVDSVLMLRGDEHNYTCERSSNLTVEKLDMWTYVRCTCPKGAQP